MRRPGSSALLKIRIGMLMKPSHKTFLRLCSSALRFNIIAILSVWINGQANGAQRPISDFVSRQGEYCLALNPVSGIPDCTCGGYNGPCAGSDCLLFQFGAPF